MKCPKCGFEQEGTEQCSGCGLIFEKYRRYQEMQAQRKAAPSMSSDADSRGGGLVLWGLLGLVLLGIGGFFALRGDEAPSVQGVATPVVVSRPASVSTPSESVEKPADSFSGLDLVAQLEEKVPAGNEVEAARNATVFLQTPWGQGAGFFINDRCAIVTNRHVIKLSENQLGQAEVEIRQAKVNAERLQKMIERDWEIYTDIQSGKARLRDRSITQNDLRARIMKGEEELKKFRQEIQERKDVLTNIQLNPRLTIVLADGTELDGSVDSISDEQDLAIVRPYSNLRCPTIPVGDSEGLKQGDTLFTVGSPMGIRHTVTSGVFSGGIDIDGQQMLQTDAPINPGNSGGPLINNEGQVVGINTLLLKNSRGIGFAIPIEQVRKQFVSL